MRPAELVTVNGLRRLAGGDDGRLEWSCALISEDLGVVEDFRAWVDPQDVPKLPRPAAAADRWVENQIEEFAQQPLASSAAASPLQLRP